MRRLASDSIVYGLGSVANQALAILLLPLYTRFLAPEDYGSLALITAAGALLSLAAAFGVSSGLTRIFFLHESKEEREAVVFTALAFACASATLIGGALVAAAPLLSPLVFDFPERDLWFRLAVVVNSVAAVSSVALGVLQVHQRARAYVACSLSGLLVSCACSIYWVAYAGRGVAGVLEGQLAGIATQLALAFVFALPNIRRSFRPIALRDMLTFSIPLLPANLAAWSLGFADRWSLKTFSSFTEVGLYALGFRFGAALETLFVSPFVLAWYPYLYSITGQPEHREIIARVLEYYTFLAGGIVLGLSLFGGDVIRLIADPAYEPAEQVIFWIGLAILIRGMTFVTATGMNIERKNHYSIVVYATGVALNLPLLYLLVPRYGMMGAAFAMLLTYSAVNAGFWWVSQRFHPVPFRPWKIALILAVMTGTHALGRLVPRDPWWLSLGLRASLLALFPVVLLAMRFFDARDVERIRAIFRKVGVA